MCELSSYKLEGVIEVGNVVPWIHPKEQLKALTRKEIYTGPSSAVYTTDISSLPLKTCEGLARPRWAQRHYLGHRN
jgi:hypothetical protein